MGFAFGLSDSGLTGPPKRPSRRVSRRSITISGRCAVNSLVVFFGYAQCSAIYRATQH
jgi:hypothetical protein